MGRLLIVSNRLPLTVARENGALRITRSSGGLATGLGGVHAVSESLWIGWAGAPTGELSADEQKELERTCQQHSLVAIPLSAEEVDRYYEQFCNGVLWPALHYMIGQLPLEVTDYDLYEQVNRRFAETAVAHYRPGDLIWVHDYQLMLVPQMIRERLPDARIGFFLHIPFPASDVFRILPARERLLCGMLGADLVGFHTAAYMRHFAAAALRILGVSIVVDRMRWDGRVVRLGVFPMGVDAAEFAQLAETENVRAQVAALRGGQGAPLLLVGLDRLDYTKGIPRRLLAYEHLLRQHPDLRGRVRLVQVAVPSRIKVERYQEFRSQVDTLIGRIHGQFATPSWVPVHYIYRGLPRDEVVALYRAADVMLVTPIRDGMNLVAKEFVASRTDEGGVLVLSEMAGAASELAEAIHVNPYDVTGSAEAYHRALTMNEDERHTRMRALRRRVCAYDVQRWAQVYLQRLVESGNGSGPSRDPSPAADLQRVVDEAKAARCLVLLIDYDGTLVPFAATPDLARPDPEALQLLERLAARPQTEVHVVSGRPRATLEHWLGSLPIWLHAEHGFWSRGPRPDPGRALDTPKLAWREQVLSILREYADRTPGSLVEEKPAGLAWHYRAADAEYGAVQANELRLHLSEILGNTPVEVLVGDKVIELRAHGVNKGRIVPPILERLADAYFLALGDDPSDEDMFAALPPAGTAIHIGPGDTVAALRVASVREVRSILRGLL